MSLQLNYVCSLLLHSFQKYCIVIELDFGNNFHSLTLFLKLIYEHHSFEGGFEKYWQIFAHNDGFLLQPM